MRQKTSWVSWIIIGICSLMVIGLSHSVYTLWKRTDLIAEQKARLQEAQKENKQLKQQFEEAQSDEYVEKQARESLGLAKPGEQVILFTHKPQEAGDKAQVQAPQEKPSLAVWWKVFF